MRIAIVCNRFTPSVGGVQTHVAELSKGFARLGHDVEVLTHVVEGTSEGVSFTDGVTVRRFERTVTLEHASFSRRLVAHVRAGDYDVLHAHSYHDPITAAVLAVWDGPAVLTPHYHGESESALRNLMHVAYRPVGRWMMRRSDRIICVSPAERGLVAEHFPRTIDRSLVISNGVHVDAIRDAYPASLDDERLAIVVAGRLEDYKRVDLVIRAMRQLRSKHKLYIVGDGSDRSRLEALVLDLELARDVRFLGRVPVETLHGYLVGSTIVVSASSLEAQGIVPLEGLAAGASVALSNIPAHRSITNAYPGRAVMFGPDPAEIVRAIDVLGSVRTGESAHLAPMSWIDVVEETLQVYAAVAPARRAEGVTITRKASAV